MTNPAAATQTEAPKAYSYLRFSTPEQAKGDSFRRQTAAAEEYCARHGLTLDTSVNYHDTGVSAFRGKNAETGRLAEFRDAVRTGLIAPGSVLLVESLDRVSRQAAYKALRILTDICEEGITVVTLADGQVYTQELLETDPTKLLVSLIVFIRANEESVTKSKRVAAAREQERQQAIQSKKPITAKCPAWLRLGKGSGEFTVIEDRAAVVQRIYRDTIAGKGQHAIAQALNEEGVPTFGDSTHWHRSYVAKILKNPAVIGEFTPCRIEKLKDGKVRRIPQTKIPGYFPAIVSAEEFAEVRAMEERGRRSAQTGTKAAEVRNLFGGLVRCGECGKTATVVYKGKKNSARFFACTGRLAKAGCAAKHVRYDRVETQFIIHVDEVLTAELATNTGKPFEEALAEITASIEGTDDALWHLIEQVEQGGPSSSITNRIRELEAAKAELETKRAEVLAKFDASAPMLVERRVKDLKAALTADPMNRARVNALLKQIFSSIRLDKENGQAHFVWKFGGETSLTIGMPGM